MYILPRDKTAKTWGVERKKPSTRYVDGLWNVSLPRET